MDFLLIDGEHGRISYNEIGHLVSEIDEKTNAFVRVPADVSGSLVCNIFDSGASGLLVSGVESRKTIQKIRNYANYPPNGTRSYSPYCPGNSYVKSEGNSPNLVGSIIESALGFANFQGIVEDSDFIYYGAYDMMIDLGEKELYSAQSLKFLYEIGLLCRGLKIPLIAMATSLREKVILFECGVNVFCIGVDSDMLLGMQENRIKEMGI